MRLTKKRNGKNVIPLLNAVCGIDMPYWRIDRADNLHSYLSGDAADKLAVYEDAEEQGLLIRLPCKVGDVVYLIRDACVWEVKVESIHQWVSGRWKVSARTLGTYFASYEIDFDGFGKVVYATREEAEAALKGE